MTEQPLTKSLSCSFKLSVLGIGLKFSKNNFFIYKTKVYNYRVGKNEWRRNIGHVAKRLHKRHSVKADH